MKNIWFKYLCTALVAAFLTFGMGDVSYARSSSGDGGEPPITDPDVDSMFADRDVCDGHSTGCVQITTCTHETGSPPVAAKGNNCNEEGTRSNAEGPEDPKDRDCWCCSTIEEKQADGTWKTKTCGKEKGEIARKEADKNGYAQGKDKPGATQ